DSKLFVRRRIEIVFRAKRRTFVYYRAGPYIARKLYLFVNERRVAPLTINGLFFQTRLKTF
ncbi:MAG: hypothetical protein ACJ8HC_18205, partial [Paraburkholderia graminis]|uniref:hypothetical protein n=1 Tax=Paraburkholderia graminis TaxID=60548 RepID=UPI003899EDB6